MYIESCKLGKMTTKALTHQKASMFIVQSFTLSLVKQDPC